MAHRNYTDEERTEVIRLISMEGKPVASVARELGVGVGTVQRWVSDAVTGGTQSRRRLRQPSPPDGTRQPRTGRPKKPYPEGEIGQTDTESALLPVDPPPLTTSLTEELMDRIGALEARLDKMMQAQKKLVDEYLKFLGS